MGGGNAGGDGGKGGGGGHAGCGGGSLGGVAGAGDGNIGGGCMGGGGGGNRSQPCSPPHVRHPTTVHVYLLHHELHDGGGGGCFTTVDPAASAVAVCPSGSGGGGGGAHVVEAAVPSACIGGGGGLGGDDTAGARQPMTRAAPGSLPLDVAVETAPVGVAACTHGGVYVSGAQARISSALETSSVMAPRSQTHSPLGLRPAVRAYRANSAPVTAASVFTDVFFPL